MAASLTSILKSSSGTPGRKKSVRFAPTPPPWRVAAATAAAAVPTPTASPKLSFEERRAVEETKGGDALSSASRMRYVLYAGGALLMVTHAAAAGVAIARL